MLIGESTPPRGADAFRLVRVDFYQKQVDGLALPPELWLNTPALSGQGIGGLDLNGIYLKGKSSATGDERSRMAAGASLLAATLQSNFGYTPDHYVVIKQPAFADYIDHLGGLNVTMPYAFAAFPAGAQHLTGGMALDLFRMPGASEWERMGRQKLILQAIYVSVMDPKNFTQIPALISTLYSDILTDLSLKQILDVSCILKQPGLVYNQQVVGPDLVVSASQGLLPRTNLGAYILQTAGK